MRTKRLIKTFEFPEAVRDKITLGTGTRLNPDTHYLQLKDLATGGFETGVWRECSTWLFGPNTVKGWHGFQADVRQVHDDLGAPLTFVEYRLGDGVDVYSWDGFAWVTPATTWNTIEEVSEHIGSFPVARQGVKALMRFMTTDRSSTPEVQRLKVCWATTVDEMEEFIYRTIIPALRDGIRPIADVLVDMAEDSDEVQIDLATPYNIVSIDSAFDETDDPKCLTDLFLSWDGATKVVTLSREVLADHVVRVRFVYVPEVAVTTSQDYVETAKVPAVIVENISLAGAYTRDVPEQIVNVGLGTGVEVLAPTQGDLDVQVLTICDKGVDHARISTACKRFFDTAKRLHSPGLDEDYIVLMTEPYASSLGADRGDLHRGRCRFRLKDVVLYLAGDRDKYAVERFHLEGSLEGKIIGDPLT